MARTKRTRRRPDNCATRYGSDTDGKVYYLTRDEYEEALRAMEAEKIVNEAGES
jgi:hypothetical protein